MTPTASSASAVADHAAEREALFNLTFKRGPLNAPGLVDIFGSLHLAGLALGFLGFSPALREGTGPDDMKPAEIQEFGEAWGGGLAMKLSGKPIPFTVEARVQIAWIEERV